MNRIRRALEAQKFAVLAMETRGQHLKVYIKGETMPKAESAIRRRIRRAGMKPVGYGWDRGGHFIMLEEREDES